MSTKRRKRGKQRIRSRIPAPSSQPLEGIRLVTMEGDPLVFTSARYRHTAMEEIREILKQADDFNLDDDMEPGPGRSWDFAWLEIRSGLRRLFAFFGQRVLARLTLTPTTLTVETMSPQRMEACHQRLEQLLGERIRLVRTRTESMG